MSPSISILLPVYNAQRYLRAAVDSLLTQTFTDYELIIIDDGSADDSLSILQAYARQDSRIRLISRPNKKLVPTLNEALALATAPYIARMDADDIALPNRLQLQLNYLRDHPEVSLLGTAVEFIDPDGDPIGPKSDTPLDHAAIDAALLAGQWPIVHPSILAPTSALQKIGGYRDYYTWEDHDLFLRLAEVGRVAALPDVLLRYRLHPASVVHQRSAEISTVLTTLLNDTRERRGLAKNQNGNLNYRPPTSLESRRNWVWWSLAAGNISTARKHAWWSMKHAPLSLDSWRALYCATRGR